MTASVTLSVLTACRSAATIIALVPDYVTFLALHLADALNPRDYKFAHFTQVGEGSVGSSAQGLLLVYFMVLTHAQA